jgi:chromosome segregation ATPase
MFLQSFVKIGLSRPRNVPCKLETEHAELLLEQEKLKAEHGGLKIRVDTLNQAWRQKFEEMLEKVGNLNDKMKLLNDRVDTLSKQVTEKIDKLTEVGGIKTDIDDLNRSEAQILAILKNGGH